MFMDFKEQYNKLYRYCYFKLRHREMAEDVTQETFLRFLESDRYKDTGKSMQYLYTIARNLCIDTYRRSRFQISLDSEKEISALDAKSAVSPPQDNLVTTLTLKAALDTLSEEERELILLRYVNEVPINIISELVGISRFAVYRKTNRLLKQLETFLKE